MAKKDRDKKIQPGKPSFINDLFGNSNFVLLMYFIVVLLMLWESLFSGRMTAGSDFLASGYMNRSFLAKYGFRLWQPYTFGGVPVVDAFFGDILYPVTIILRQIFAAHLVPVLLYLIHLPIAGFFTYLFVRDQKVSAPVAFLSGLFYMMTGCIVSLINAGQDGRLIVNCLLPGVIFFINRGYEQKRFFYFILTGFFFALAILSPHVQMAYYLALTSVFFVVYKTITTWRAAGPKACLKPGLSYVLAAVIGIALAACLILPVFNYINFSPRGGLGRGYAWATSWAMPPEEILNLLTPHFSGILDNYWGRNYFKLHTEYIGILPLLLALFAFLRDWKNPLTKFLLVLGAFALIFAWGGHTPVYWLFYTFLPYVSKTRAPSQIFYIFSFAIAVLAGLGGHRLLSDEANKKSRLVFYIGAGAFMLWVVATIFAQGFISLLSPLAKGRERILSADYPHFQTGLFILFLLALGYAIMTHLVHRKRLGLALFTIIAGAVFFIDMWRIEKNYINTVPPPSKYFAPDDIVRVLSEDRSLFRVFPFDYRRPEDNYLMLHSIQSIGGEHGNHLYRYQEFIGAEHSVMFEPKNLFYPNFLKLLNAKYVIMPNYDLSQIPEFNPDPRVDAMIKTVRYVTNPAHFKLFYQGSRQIYENLSCLPRAFVVPQYTVITEKHAILETIKSTSFNPARTVILETDPGVPPSLDSVAAAQVEIADYEPDRVTIEATLAKPGFLVLTDNYYPLWKATVDDQAVRIYRANYTFRAIPLASGKHEIVFYFDSPYFRLGVTISLVTLGIALVLLFLSLRPRRPANAVSTP